MLKVNHLKFLYSSILQYTLASLYDDKRFIVLSE